MIRTRYGIVYNQAKEAGLASGFMTEDELAALPTEDRMLDESAVLFAKMADSGVLDADLQALVVTYLDEINNL